MTDTKEKGKTSTWDWITRILAILAFVISTITTYVTVFQKTTRLSFVVDSFPAAYRIDPRSMSYTPEPIQVVFLNDGTVAAVPFFISISFREIANYLPPKCVGAEDEGAIVFYTDFSVATVPAKGTVARKINVVDSNLYQSMGIETKKKGWYRFPVAKEFEEAEFQMMVCMTVGFVSYANAVEYRTVRLYFHSVSKNQFVVEGDGAPVSSVGIMKKPYQLLSYSDPIWNMFFGP